MACAGVLQAAALLCPALTVQVELAAQVLDEIPLADLDGRLLGACQSKPWSPASDCCIECIGRHHKMLDALHTSFIERSGSILADHDCDGCGCLAIVFVKVWYPQFTVYTSQQLVIFHDVLQCV